MDDKQSLELHFADMPSTVFVGLKALIARKPMFLAAGKEIPKLTGIIEGYEPDLAELELYRQLFDLPDDGCLPCTFPVVMIQPLLLQLLTSPAFPIKPSGLVQTSQVINQYKKVADDAPLNLKVSFGETERNSAGTGFDVLIEIYAHEQLVWCATTRLLNKTASEPVAKTEKPMEKPVSKGAATKIKSLDEHLPRDLGRKYAKVSGDLNPIRNHPWLAKLFGFKSHIVDGMWVMAWAAKHLLNDKDVFEYSMDFKAPIQLPNNIMLSQTVTAEGRAFSIASVNQSDVYVTGQVSQAVANDGAVFEEPVQEEEFIPAPTTMHEEELMAMG